MAWQDALRFLCKEPGAKTQTCQVPHGFCFFRFCAEGSRCLCIRWTGRGRPAADACTDAKVQDCTDAAHSQRKAPAFCLTNPFYLFIYLLNYLLIPSLVWPFNDPPEGVDEMECWRRGQITVLVIYWGKIKTNAGTRWPFTVGTSKVCVGLISKHLA